MCECLSCGVLAVKPSMQPIYDLIIGHSVFTPEKKRGKEFAL